MRNELCKLLERSRALGGWMRLTRGLCQMRARGRCKGDASVGLPLWAAVALSLATAVVADTAMPLNHTQCDLLIEHGKIMDGQNGLQELIQRGQSLELVGVWPRSAGDAGRALAAIGAAFARRYRYGRLHLRPANGSDAFYGFQVKVESEAILASARLHLWLVSNEGQCSSATVWTFYAKQNNIMRCNFFRMDDVKDWDKYDRVEASYGSECEKCAVVLASRRVKSEAVALQKRALVHELLLRVLIVDNISQAFQSSGNRSLLFLDQQLWSDMAGVHAVYSPPCVFPLDSDCSFDLDYSNVSLSMLTKGIFLHAPLLNLALERYRPSIAHIRDVLDLEAVNGYDIEEAACDWYLQNRDDIDSALPKLAVDFNIRLYLCIEDPDFTEYQQMTQIIINVFNLRFVGLSTKNVLINCSREDALIEQFLGLLNKPYEQHTIGWLAKGVGTSKLYELAEMVRMPIISYDAPPSALKPNSVVRAVAGSLRVLARSYLHAWSKCGNQRITLISDGTPYSNKLTSFINKGGLIVREKIVSTTESIKAVLITFQKLGVRSFFVNGDAEMAARVLCSAQEVGMTEEYTYTWWVREWRKDGDCGPTAPLSVGLSWRGEEGAQEYTARVAGWGAGRAGGVRRALEARWAGRAWPPLAGALADALLLLGHAFENFFDRHPESIFDRRFFGNNTNFAEAVNETINGVSQQLRYIKSNFELATSVVFVEKWSGERRALRAVWRAEGEGFSALWERGPLCEAIESGFACLSTSSGDPFAPNCHDYIWLSIIIVFVFVTLALYYARRARLRNLKLRDLALREQLLERRKNNNGKFASHLVSRHEFELREELGSGEHGRVCVAVLRRPHQPPVAVAAKETSEARPQNETGIIREASVLSTLKHKNIVQFFGMCLDGPARFFMEYAFFGDLNHYLSARRALAEFASKRTFDASLDSDDVDEASHVSARALTQLARDAASALDYLARQRIVHRDVRAANCLIDETRTLKLADFALARTLDHEDDEYVNHHLTRLPIACMAPESLTSGVFSKASDIWGLGVLMLEIVTLGAPPYGKCRPAEIINRVKFGEHPPLPSAATTLTRGLLTCCWLLHPSERPSAAQVGAFLELNPTALAPAISSSRESETSQLDLAIEEATLSIE